MSCEHKDEQFTLRFLDCDCTCCGIRQQHTPPIECQMDRSQFRQIIKNISKPRYGLDCQCLCGEKSSAISSKDSCSCPTMNTNMATPIQVNFSVDTGIKQSSNV
ncbi:unnamed protein product [Adineta ricciae]|uniref:Uncharacterized protein n=1 Tax=Adineta ricciae TaxID=249248 RepID=A0A814ET07_ADIRI|nr:unnamed protein product [Adineta ricciae]CAF1405594.1 unnamed protein product [Adineta ricciae]